MKVAQSGPIFAHCRISAALSEIETIHEWHRGRSTGDIQIFQSSNCGIKANVADLFSSDRTEPNKSAHSHSSHDTVIEEAVCSRTCNYKRTLYQPEFPRDYIDQRGPCCPEQWYEHTLCLYDKQELNCCVKAMGVRINLFLWHNLTHPDSNKRQV